jgi:hypothetical protein
MLMYAALHTRDLQSNRMSRFYYAQTVPGGHHANCRRLKVVRRLLLDRGFECLGR